MQIAQPDSSELLESLRERDPETLSKIVRANLTPLLRAARAMGFRKEEAEDLVQEAFAAFLGSIDRFEGRSLIRTWLFGILFRKAQEVRRRLGRESREEPVDNDFESRFDATGSWVTPPTDMGRLLESRELGLAIEGCLDDLPSSQRRAFVLKEIEGLDSAEVCKILDITTTNMGVFRTLARTQLRE